MAGRMARVPTRDRYCRPTSSVILTLFFVGRHLNIFYDLQIRKYVSCTLTISARFVTLNGTGLHFIGYLWRMDLTAVSLVWNMRSLTTLHLCYLLFYVIRRRSMILLGVYMMCVWGGGVGHACFLCFIYFAYLRGE